MLTPAWCGWRSFRYVTASSLFIIAIVVSKERSATGCFEYSSNDTNMNTNLTITFSVVLSVLKGC